MKNQRLYLLLSGLGIAIVVGGMRTKPLSPHAQRIARVIKHEGSSIAPGLRPKLIVQISALADLYNIDPHLIMAIIAVESRFQPNARSHRGAMGLMQVMPIVVREVGKDLSLRAPDAHKLADPTLNLRVGIHYLSGLLKRFKGDMIKTLKAYNEGPTRVADRYLNRAAPPSAYTQNVLSHYYRYRQL